MQRPITSVGADEARRIALAAQGFAQTRPAGRVDRRHLRQVFDRIGLIQIDSVNVLVRSQELALLARLGEHPRDLISRATQDGELFEYWGHAAAHVPTAHHRLWRWKMAAAISGPWRSAEDLLKRRPAYIEEVFQRVRAHGPLVASDLAQRVGKKGSWWDWDDGKEALEYLFMCGRLSATRRAKDFARVYDLTERVIPRQHLQTPTPSMADAQRELLDLGSRSLGIGTVSDIADYYRLKPVVAQPLIMELVEAGRLLPVQVEARSEKIYVHVEAKIPRAIETSALLSMFDPIVWNRSRAQWLFDFYYRIEIYTPAHKRIYGYYVLPFLLNDKIVARVDLKADRQDNTLRVHGIFSEAKVHKLAVTEGLCQELSLMAKWLGLEKIAVGTNGDLCKMVSKALAKNN